MSEIREFAAEKVHETALSLIEKTSGIVLDAGCGAGALSVKLKDLGFNVIAFDKDINQIKFLNNKNIKLISGNLNNKLKFKNNTFDAIFCLEVVEHLENPRYLLREFKRVLKPSGYIILSTPNVTNFISRINFLIRGFLWGFSEKQYLTNRHITPVSLKDIRVICKELNLTISEVTYNKGKFIMPYFSITLPFKNNLFGEVLVTKINK